MNSLRTENLQKGEAITSEVLADQIKFIDAKGNDYVFDASLSHQIDANKYSLYDIVADPRIELFNIGERLEMMSSWVNDLHHNNHNLYRRPLESGCRPIVSVRDPYDNYKLKDMINMASNDYLNLSQHPRVIMAGVKCLLNNGAGSGGAPMLSGTTRRVEELESKIAEIKECEDAVVFTSGYCANVGVISTLLRKNDVAIFDMYAHASLMDGASNTNKKFFKHNDMESLETVLKKCEKEYINKLVVVDGVYSMDGDIAPLDKIVELAKNYNALVLVDEAHATGVIGENGRGTIEHYGLKGKVDIVTGTLSKALGSVGGFVAGSKQLINYIHFASRPYIFSTSSFQPSIDTALEAINIIEEEPTLRLRLWENIKYLRTNLERLGFNIGKSETAIFPIIVGNDYKVKEFGYLLHKAGVFVNSVPYPAVPRKLTRVKLTVTAGHTLSHLETAVFHLERIGKELDII